MQLLPAAALILIALLTPASAAMDTGNTARSFKAALEAARSDPAVQVSMQIHCNDSKGIRSMQLFTSGVMIWNHDRQARIGSEDRTELLDLLWKADFSAFKDSYGGKQLGEKAGAPIQVICSIDVQAGAAKKSSVQDANGERSETFMQLAAALLNRIEPLAAKGVTAESLDDGLNMLAAGALAPETLSLRLFYMPSVASQMGVIVNIESAQLVRRDYRPGVKVGEPRSLVLSKPSLDSLLTAIRQADFPALPGNLAATDVYQLKIQVLQHQHSVRARPGGTDPLASQGKASARFIELANRIIELEQPGI